MTHMPRYFFHTADGSRDRDLEGVDLEDHGVARKEAIKFAGSVLNDQPSVLWDGRDFRVEVTNRKGDLLFTIITLAVNAPAGGDTQ